MQSITVAVADINRERREIHERLLCGEEGIQLLSNLGGTDGGKNDHAFSNRRLMPPTDLSACEHEVARIKRLRPNIMLVNLDVGLDDECVLFLSLHKACPESYIVVLADDSVHERYIIQALAIGARGYLKSETVETHLLKALRVVARGEAWVSRKVIGDILERVLS